MAELITKSFEIGFRLKSGWLNNLSPNTKMRLKENFKTRINNAIIYFGYAATEAFNLGVYLNAVIVGLTICFLTDHYTIAPFLVPLFVQIVVKSSVKYRQRHINALVELPAQIEDPAFIMDRQGNIVLSTGKTEQLFKEHAVANLEALLGREGLDRILRASDSFETSAQLQSREVYSLVTEKWYEVKAKPAAIKYGEKSKKILVWFQDITLRKLYDFRLQDLLRYSGSVISSLKDLAKGDLVYDHLASFMLSDYEAVFITRIDKQGDLVGNAFKKIGDEIIKSDRIRIPKESMAPIYVSRRVSKILSGDASSYPSEQAFIQRHPFDRQVIDFIDRSIRNYITYNEGDVSIIAFNFRTAITAHEKQFIEALLNISKTIVTLVDLAQESEDQFMQKVMGLCAAAEYSGEIGGNHVLRVNAYSRFLAEKLDMDNFFVETIGQVAALHDIGKVAMPLLIRNSNEYSANERLRMQMHTVYGAGIIDNVMKYALKEDDRLIMARNIALHHHQAFNGGGYPNLISHGEIVDELPTDYQKYLNNQPLKGAEIPLEALIVSLADRYDALRSESHHKPALSHQAVMEIMTQDDLSQSSGEEQHGPELCRIFLENHQEFDRIFNSLQ